MAFFTSIPARAVHVNEPSIAAPISGAATTGGLWLSLTLGDAAAPRKSRSALWPGRLRCWRADQCHGPSTRRLRGPAGTRGRDRRRSPRPASAGQAALGQRKMEALRPPRHPAPRDPADPPRPTLAEFCDALAGAGLRQTDARRKVIATLTPDQILAGRIRKAVASRRHALPGSVTTLEQTRREPAADPDGLHRPQYGHPREGCPRPRARPLDRRGRRILGGDCGTGLGDSRAPGGECPHSHPRRDRAGIDRRSALRKRPPSAGPCRRGSCR